MSKTRIIPTPTDAVMYLNGHVPQPANPIFFNTIPEARELLADLQAHDIVPSGAKILDVSYAAGPVVYGTDGRQILGIQWHAEDGALQEVFAGLLYWRWKELTDAMGAPTGTWRNLGEGNIGRW